MPDRGLLDLSTLGDAAFDAPGGVTIEDARWLQVTFEVDRQAALEHTPCDVGRPIPPYARLFVATAENASLAVLSVGGRYKMMPRNVVVSAVVQGTGTGLFGQATTPGRIELARHGQEVSARVSGPDGPLARVLLPSAYAIEPSMLRWDAFVAFARLDGEPAIGEITPAHSVETAFLSKGAELTIEASLPRTHPWRRLRSLAMISACYAEGTLRFGEPTVESAS